MAGWTPRVIEGEQDTVLPPETINVAREARSKAGHEETVLLERARSLLQRRGPNHWSDYVLMHKKHPPPTLATAFAKAYGGRFRADDGKLYPPLSKKKADVEARREQREEAKRRAGARDEIWRLNQAVQLLAMNSSRLADLSPHFFVVDARITGKHLEKAVDWLVRFARAWGEGTVT